MYSAVQNVLLGFSVTSYGKTQMVSFANPIIQNFSTAVTNRYEREDKQRALYYKVRKLVR